MKYNHQGSPRQRVAYNATCFIPKGDTVEKDLLNDIDSQGTDDVEEFKDNLLLIENAKKDDLTEANFKVAKQCKEERKEDKKKDAERLVSEGYKSKDGDDPLVYSRIIGVGPYSFITFDCEYRASSPPPTYLSDKELNMLTKTTREEFLDGFIIPKQGGLMCIDKGILKRQSGVIATMIGQLITTMCISKISLPVRIFEPRTALERIADLWRCAPIYLSAAARTGDKVEKMKNVIAFAISGIYTGMQQLKPFNPLIGETMEASLADGTRFFLEHTSHHPPISNFFVQGPQNSYTMYGHHEYRGNVTTNGLENEQHGPNIVEFPDGTTVQFAYPRFKIHGLLMGDRMIYPSGEMVFEDKSEGLRAVIIFNYGKKRGLFSSRKKGTRIDDFDGVIYKVKPDVKSKSVGELKDLKDVDERICSVSGSWLGQLKIGNQVYWDIEKVELPPLNFAKNPLPTDWRFREDLIWLRRGNTEISQEWKVRLEIEQRRDRGTREKFKPDDK
eukprot:TRINITY_DN5091_c0_g2_i1.p1 TRINITY_DN5091_c0_g2~~TRINITY_DN5091_c0_g2_i1.p1  ORF type:complete len:501 (-),score=132.62 TRINITY_DN5091_c0_g2_i1:126-1628(-)